MSKTQGLLKTRTFWAGLAALVIALGTYFADDNTGEAVNQGVNGAMNIVMALMSAGVITQRSAIAKLARQVEDLSRQIADASEPSNTITGVKDESIA